MISTKQYRRVLYYGMINTSHYSTYAGQNLYVAAGSLKMLSVAKALKAVNVRATIITLPVLGNKHPRRSVKQFISGKDGVPVLFLPVFRNKFMRKIFGSISFALVSLFLVSKRDKVIIYNHALEYIPSLFILFVRGIPVFHDIEDLPFENDYSVNGLMNSIGYWFADNLSRKKILVSNRLADILSLKDYVVVNGVCNTISNTPSERWLLLKSNNDEPLRVHYGGTLISDTGIDLFCGAIKLLVDSHPGNLRPIHFHITGTGQLYKLDKLQHLLSSTSTVKLFINRYLSYKDYIDLLASCHISLALKKPDTQMANTTFPSKVIEITSYGLALISSRVSDVPLIFNDSNSFLLPSFSSRSLSNTILYCARSPRQVIDVANSGRELISKNFSPAAVGTCLSRYLNLY